MNRRVFETAGRLPAAERRRDRGAFFGSIHATLNHLLWSDNQWMSRFDGWDKPPVVGRGGTEWFSDFSGLEAVRINADSYQNSELVTLGACPTRHVSDSRW